MRKLVCLILLSALHFGCINTEIPKENASQNLEDSLVEIAPIEESYIAEPTKELDSIKQVILKHKANDTASHVFSLEGNFSAEGNEGRAFYKNDSISKIEIIFYGESGKNAYIYQFKNNKIEVVQQRYNYKTNFMEVKSKDDIITGEKVKYILNIKGEIINGDKTLKESDVFLDLQKAIPFHLN